MQIISEAQFLSLMNEIDERLKNSGILIPARPIQAWVRVARLTQENLPFTGNAVRGLYEGGSLSGHIHDWYDRRYGKRLNIDPCPVIFPTLIRDDLYMVRVPLLAGNILLTVDRAPSQSDTAPALCNLMDWVRDLSVEIRNALSNEECNNISKDCFEALCQGGYWREAGKLFRAAIDTDLRLSAALAVEGKFGFSRYHSLQAAEKALKAYIHSKGGKPKRIHDLRKLVEAARKLRFSDLPENLLDAAQCSAEVRYSQTGSNPLNCYQANRAARMICTAVANHLAIARGHHPHSGTLR